MNYWLSRAVLLPLVVALWGCSEANLPQLERELEAMRTNPGQVNLEPLPPMPSYVSVDYRFADERSPFRARMPEAQEVIGGDAGLKPDLSRPKQPLESYDLSQLELVGTLMVGGQPSALIESPEGTVHRLRVGDRMGTDFGRIVGITNSSVQLVEIVPTGRGGWVERTTRLTLEDQSASG
jgi:type IV pilus assembly protein PilP